MAPRSLFVLSITGFVALVSFTTLHAADKPNVVVFLVDDMGWTDWQRDSQLNPTGSLVYETPNMIRLAQMGVVFSENYASASICSPSRSALVTGKAPARNRITNWITGPNHTTDNLEEPSTWVKNLAPTEVTVADSLKSAGYDTAYIGKWHLGQSGNAAANPNNFGFDLNIGGTHNGSPPGGYFAGNDGGWNAPGLTSGYNSDDYLTDVLTDHAVDYISQNANQQDPFFAMVSHYAVHTPIQAPQSLVTKYSNKINTLQNNGVDVQGHTNPTFAAMVETMDTSLGRVLDALEDPNDDEDTSDSILDDTLIIFTSDNGGLKNGPTNNLPLREGKGSLYEGGIKTPLLVSWTGNSSIVQNRVDTTRAIGHDVPTTILDATGLLDDGVTPQTPAAERDGVSFLDAVEGQVLSQDYEFWHYPHEHNQGNNGNIQGASYVSVVRQGKWKLMYFYDEELYRLFDTEADISETTNVLDQNPDVATNLSFQLRNYLSEVDAQAPVSLATGQPVGLPPAILSSIAGDFNGDGLVSAADWIVLRNNLYKDVSDELAEIAFSLGDSNLDGVINRRDFNLFKSAFESANGAGSFATLLTAVPEPTTSALVLCGVTSAFIRSRR